MISVEEYKAKLKELLGWVDPFLVQNFANARKEYRAKQRGKNNTQAKRKKICESCEFLNGDICSEIKKKTGCSACSIPWSIRHVKCPKKLW